MKKIVVSIVWIALLGCSSATAYRGPGSDKPAVFALDKTALASSKARIKSGDEQAKKAYKQLIKDADAALKFGPVSVMEKTHMPPSGNKHDYMSLAPYHWPDPAKADGLPYIRKDGQTNPEVRDYKDKEYMPKLCAEVQTLALAYYFSDENVYAEHAAKLLRVWFLDTATRMNPNLNFAQAIKGVTTGRGAGMIDSRHFVKLIDGIGLIQDSKYWTEKDQAGMQQWFTDLLQWMATSKNGIEEMNAGNNHGAWYDAQKLSMALFTGNIDLAKKTVISAQDRLDKQMDETGKFPREMERTTSLHYTTFVMEALFNIALMAEEAGMDLWNYTSPSGKSLKKAFTVLQPYLTKQKEWEGQQIKPFEYEEGYFLLLEAGRRFKCKSCSEEVRQLAGDKADRLRINLFY
jgi:hypothetical protein